MEPHNSISCYKDAINKHVADHLKTICEILNRSRNLNNFTPDSFVYSSYTVKSAISEYRLQLIEIVGQNLEYNPKNLNEVPDLFWGTLVHWYFENWYILNYFIVIN